VPLVFLEGRNSIDGGGAGSDFLLGKGAPDDEIATEIKKVTVHVGDGTWQRAGGGHGWLEDDRGGYFFSNWGGNALYGDPVVSETNQLRANGDCAAGTLKTVLTDRFIPGIGLPMKTFILCVILAAVGYHTMQNTGNSPVVELERAEKRVEQLQAKAERARNELDAQQRVYFEAASRNGRVVTSSCGARCVTRVDMGAYQQALDRAQAYYITCQQELVDAQRTLYTLRREVQNANY